jgi:hypothetical protein
VRYCFRWYSLWVPSPELSQSIICTFWTYCHVLSDYRRVLDSQLDLLDHNTVMVYTQLNTIDHNARARLHSLPSAGPRTSCRPNSRLWLFSEDYFTAPVFEIYSLGTDRREDTLSERTPRNRPLFHV